MTICIATDNCLHSNNGISTFNRHLSSLLLLAGHKVIILCTDENAAGEPDEVTNQENLTTVIFKESYLREKEKYKYYYPPGSFDAPRWIAMGKTYAFWLRNNSERFAIDIVEATDYGGIGVFLYSENLPPVVLTAHTSLLQVCHYNNCPKDDHYNVIKKLEELSFHHADAVITHSKLSCEAVKRLTKKPVYKATIPWINRETRIRAGNEGYGLVVGGVQTIKGAEILCESIDIINKSDCRVFINWIGEDSCTSPVHTSLAQYLQKKYPAIWNKQISWKGVLHHSNVLTEIEKAGFVVVPSLWESFNYVALEAAEAGKAMIMTDQAGVAELFEHNKNALIVPAGNETNLAQAIIELINNPEKREQLGRNSYDMVQAVFASYNIDQRIKIYEEVIDHFKGRPNRNDPDFLDGYHTAYRKLYFQSRNIIKRMIGQK